MQLARCQAFASTCTFIRFGSLTTAQLAEYDDMGCKSTPFIFYFHHIIRVTSALHASCYHPRCLHQPHCHPHQYRTRHVLLDVIYTAGILFSSTSYLSHRIVQFPSVPMRAPLTIHEARRPSRCIIFAIVFAAGSLTAIVIENVLVASCVIRQTAFVSVTQSYATNGDEAYRCKFDLMNRTGLSYNAWNQMRV